MKLYYADNYKKISKMLIIVNLFMFRNVIRLYSDYMKIFKRILFFVVGFMVFILGLICLMIPFLPFGWLLIIVSCILFLPYFPSIKRALIWLEKRDRTGFSRKLKKWSSSFYNWTHDIEKCEEGEDPLIDDCYKP